MTAMLTISRGRVAGRVASDAEHIERCEHALCAIAALFGLQNVTLVPPQVALLVAQRVKELSSDLGDTLGAFTMQLAAIGKLSMIAETAREHIDAGKGEDAERAVATYRKLCELLDVEPFDDDDEAKA